MSKLTKIANRYGRNDPNYRKALILTRMTTSINKRSTSHAFNLKETEII